MLNQFSELSRVEVGEAQEHVHQLRQSIWQHGEFRTGETLYLPNEAV
jgi:hypothetical protein